MKSWIRFNAREAADTGDGLYGPVMGNPDVPRWLGALFMRLAFSASSQNKKDFRYIRSSAAVAVVYSEVDDIPHWIEAGRCYERPALPWRGRRLTPASPAWRSPCCRTDVHHMCADSATMDGARRVPATRRFGSAR